MRGLLEKIFDFLFPRSQTARRLAGMSAEDFAGTAKPARLPDGENVFAIWDYGDPLVKEAVWQLKYRGNRQAAELLAGGLAAHLAGFLEDAGAFENFTKPILVPVPIGRKKLLERGFNQCALICHAMKEDLSEIELSEKILLKIKETPSQARTENRTARLKNLKNSFGVAEDADIAGRNIILIDDVVTTGATVDEARRALLKAGAKRVVAFAVAH